MIKLTLLLFLILTQALEHEDKTSFKGNNEKDKDLYLSLWKHKLKNQWRMAQDIFIESIVEANVPKLMKLFKYLEEPQRRVLAQQDYIFHGSKNTCKKLTALAALIRFHGPNKEKAKDCTIISKELIFYGATSKSIRNNDWQYIYKWLDKKTFNRLFYGSTEE